MLDNNVRMSRTRTQLGTRKQTHGRTVQADIEERHLPVLGVLDDAFTLKWRWSRQTEIFILIHYSSGWSFLWVAMCAELWHTDTIYFYCCVLWDLCCNLPHRGVYSTSHLSGLRVHNLPWVWVKNNLLVLLFTFLLVQTIYILTEVLFQKRLKP